MPSVRVKRQAGYTTLGDTLDVPNSDQPTRPRARSLAGLFAPASQQASTPPPVQDVPLTVQADHGRRRSHTVSNQQRGSAYEPSSPRPTLGRVSSHIMSKTKAPVASTSEDTTHLGSTFLSRAGRSLSSGSRHSQRTRSRTSMISLEGAREDILIPADEGHEPGRIGSALSLHSMNPDEPYDDEHHHDDIVEHLDVIGAFLLTCGSCSGVDPHSFCRPSDCHSIDAHKCRKFYCNVSPFLEVGLYQR